MAGIGFILRDLVRQDDLLGVLRAFGHSAIISCAPWLITVVTLAGLSVLGTRFTSQDEASLFRILIIYNFGFSLVLTAPILHVATRIFADAIYLKSVDRTVTQLFGVLAAAYGVCLVCAAPLYVLVADLTAGVALAAVVNAVATGGVWAVTVFLSALKDYRTITLAFLGGLASSFVLGLALSAAHGTSGMLWGFTAGLVVLQATLIARVTTEFPRRLVDPRPLLGQYAQYQSIGLGGLLYALGIWADKWIMWFAPERHRAECGLIYYPDYDGAMFLAFLTTIPAFATFTMAAETDFFEAYSYYRNRIRTHQTLDRIKQSEREIVSTVIAAFRNITIIQGTFTILAILLAPQVVSSVGETTLQVGMFRIATLGAFFHVMFMFITIKLAYFDLRRPIAILYGVFLLTNVGFTFLSVEMGFRYYGSGYFLASVVSFAVASFVLIWALQRLRYLTFVVRR